MQMNINHSTRSVMISLVTLDMRTYFSFNHSRISMYKTISMETIKREKYTNRDSTSSQDSIFPKIGSPPDLDQANTNLVVALNSSIQEFYKTYATYLGEDFTSLCGN